MNNRQQFIKQFFSEIANLKYTYLNFIGGELNNIDTQSDLAILVEPNNFSTISSIIRDAKTVEKVNIISMYAMDQFVVTFKDGDQLNIDCMSKLLKRNMVFLSNDYIFENTVVRSGVKCCNNKSFFELMMLYHTLNNEGMPLDYCNYFKLIPSSDNIVTAFNKKYHTGFTFDNICDHDSEFKDQLKSYLSIMKDNAFGENLKNTFSYAKEKCTRMLTGREKVAPFARVETMSN